MCIHQRYFDNWPDGSGASRTPRRSAKKAKRGRHEVEKKESVHTNFPQ